MNVLIVDDERKSRTLLNDMLQTFCKEVKNIHLAKDTNHARLILNEQEIDLVFLDIQMPDENGIEFLSTYDLIPFNFIFTTAYEQYALDAFKFGAIDYLLKPYNPERLILALERIKSQILLKEKKAPILDRISIPTIEGFSIITIDEIEYLKAEGNYTKIYFNDRSNLLVSKNLKRFENQLSAQKFLRIHRSIMVRLDAIVNYKRGKITTVAVHSGAILEVSKNVKQELLSLLNIVE